jgi:hypothetical protein
MDLRSTLPSSLPLGDMSTSLRASYHQAESSDLAPWPSSSTSSSSLLCICIRDSLQGSTR